MSEHDGRDQREDDAAEQVPNPRDGEGFGDADRMGLVLKDRGSWEAEGL